MSVNTADILMRIVGVKGPMDGESLTRFEGEDKADILRKDFIAGQFCELMEFSFGVGIESRADPAKAQPAANGTAVAAKPPVATTPEPPVSELEMRLRMRREHLDKMTKLENDPNKFVDIQQVEYTRLLDSASTLLFQALSACDTLPSISIVKRKAAGGSHSGDCYLRLDFKKVLLTKLDWKDNGHVMLESGAFIYRELVVSYRPQKPDGTLGKLIQTEWKMETTRAGT